MSQLEPEWNSVWQASLREINVARLKSILALLAVFIVPPGITSHSFAAFVAV
jgi:hypothetical protein